MKRLSTLYILLFLPLFLIAQTKTFDMNSFRKSGTAVQASDQCFRLTEAIEWQGGSVWYKTPINLDQIKNQEGL